MELYSWLGAGKFEESNIAAFTKGGTIGSGLFASQRSQHLIQLWPTFRYGGQALRYNYEVPLFDSPISAHHRRPARRSRIFRLVDAAGNSRRRCSGLPESSPKRSNRSTMGQSG